jgi:hypothetical protein
MFDWLKKKGGAGGGRGPDFSHVDSPAKVQELANRGELHKLLLMPAEFGGPDIAPNAVFVPAFAVDMKTRIDQNIIASLVREGKVKHYEATPQYEGRSFVPSCIRIVASDPGSFASDVAIWGKALSESKAPV